MKAESFYGRKIKVLAPKSESNLRSTLKEQATFEQSILNSKHPNKRDSISQALPHGLAIITKLDILDESLSACVRRKRFLTMTSLLFHDIKLAQDRIVALQNATLIGFLYNCEFSFKSWGLLNSEGNSSMVAWNHNTQSSWVTAQGLSLSPHNHLFSQTSMIVKQELDWTDMSDCAPRHIIKFNLNQLSFSKSHYWLFIIDCNDPNT